MTKTMLVLAYIWGVVFKGMLILLGLLSSLLCCYKQVISTSICLISSIGLIVGYVYLTVEETICLYELWKEVVPKRISLRLNK